MSRLQMQNELAAIVKWVGCELDRLAVNRSRIGLLGHKYGTLEKSSQDEGHTLISKANPSEDLARIV